MKRVAQLMSVENVSAARNALAKTINYQPPSADTSKKYLIGKFNEVNNLYKHLTGLDELEYYHDRVVELQDQLVAAQAKRRETNNALKDLRTRSKYVQDELHKVKRHDEPARFLDLMKVETEYIQRERDTSVTLSEQERDERDLFTALTAAIRDSQEKQRNRLEYAKYIGFALTAVGALASYAITTWRTADLKHVIRTSIREDVETVFAMAAASSTQMAPPVETVSVDTNKAVIEERVEQLEQSYAEIIQSLEAVAVAMGSVAQQLAVSSSPPPPPPPLPLVLSGEEVAGMLRWVAIGSAALVTFCCMCK